MYHFVVTGENPQIGTMSRLIIRNLPKNIKEERVRSIFAAKGELTDVKLCHTKDGKFRRFGFIGYKTEDQAKDALQHFNSSFIDTSKITVDFAKSLGDESLPRPWSRYSEGSSANDRLRKRKERKAEELLKDRVSKPTEAKDPSEIQSINKEKSSVVNEKNKKKRTKALDDLEHDTEFQEFLSVHKHRGSKQTWGNDNVERGQPEPKENQTRQRKEKTVAANKSSENQLKYDDSDDSGNEDEVYDASGVTEEWKYEDTENSGENEEEEVKKAKDSKLSDMDYLKSKIVSSKQKTLKTKKSKRSQNNKSDDSENEEDETRESLDDETMDTSTRESDQDNSDNDDTNNDDDDDDDVEEGYDERDDADGDDNDDNNNVNDGPKESSVFGTIKMRGLPFKAKEQHIKDFFAPLRIVNIRIIKNVKGKPTGCAFVDFANEKDIKEALKRDRDCIEGRYIELFRDKGDQTLNQETDKEKPWMKKLAAQGGEEEFESIAESGRLFLRNLAYACSEEDLQNLFEKFGPLTETYLPLDKTTNKPIGIGFVTFVMPEHAVKAFNELDGKIFQGRLLHILPSKAKETKDEDTDTAMSFKSKRDAKKKSLSSHDHNWNTLFLGMNAVADVMADQYNTTKGSILDDASSSSLAVRMALGETQVVTETRKFLVSQGVKLDVFGQPSAKRSKTVILVKNLPFNTPCEELRNIFTPFGKVARLVLPPSGITALVEFFEPSQAKKAFQKLAYSKFKHVPLYLEWAPLGVFSGKPGEKLAEGMETSEATKENKGNETPGDKESNTQDDEGGDSENIEGTSVFIKNLNFNTTEDSLKEAFSKLGPLLSATIAKKKDPKKPGHLLSMGYGFVEYKKRSDALKAIKELQNSTLEGHTLELKMSHRKASDKVVQRKSASTKKQNSSKILVRNVPFEASKKELKELFGTFGEIKTLRLPQKLSGSGTHRGFAFVDFLTKQDAKRAFESLCSSTHLYGRRLVLEWAEDEDSVDALRKRTAEHFHGTPKTAKKKKDILDDLLDTEMPE